MAKFFIHLAFIHLLKMGIQEIAPVADYNTVRMGLNQKGATLIELMISVGIGVIVCLGISSLLVFTVREFVVIAEKNKAQERVVWGEYFLRYYLSNAVGMVGSAPGAPAPDTALAYPGTLTGLLNGGNGGIIAANYFGNASDTTAATNQIDPIGVFLREVGPDPAGASIFYLTAIYYQRPISAGGQSPAYRGGKLIFSTGTNPVPFPLAALPAGSDTIQALPGDPSVDHIVYFSISTNSPISNAPKSATVTFVVRYFLDSDTNGWTWCMPTGSIANVAGQAGCVVNAPHVDTVNTIQVGFRNNVLLPGGMVNGNNAAPQRLYGGLYFFAQHMPMSLF